MKTCPYCNSRVDDAPECPACGSDLTKPVALRMPGAEESRRENQFWVTSLTVACWVQTLNCVLVPLAGLIWLMQPIGGGWGTLIVCAAAKILLIILSFIMAVAMLAVFRKVREVYLTEIAEERLCLNVKPK